MKRITMKNIRQALLMLVALEIIAISINLFYAPHQVAAGGATGIAILLEAAFNWNVSLVVLVINLVMLVLSYLFLGKGTTLRIMAGSFLLPVFLALTPQVKVVDDRLLDVIVGGAIFAIGLSILYRIDASSGGTSVPPLIIKKYFRIKPSISLLVIDGIVCFFNIFVSGTEAFILALFSSVITSILMNYIETGLDRKRAVYIMSNEDLAEIKLKLLQRLEKGLTVFAVTGGYTGVEREMLMLVVENQDYQAVINQIHAVDSTAFIFTTPITEIHGGQI
ncbi:YitT family protein [Loigolactobacillus iwatensis]|uniref:YitT family protein n=1 Tax=Loigolactobacillus iwatensis TaxID=1267156 RepID=UPI000F7E5BF6|nr:YitT family protein [Loigolactobacillus iwatensis]